MGSSAEIEPENTNNNEYNADQLKRRCGFPKIEDSNGCYERGTDTRPDCIGKTDINPSQRERQCHK